jgi:hypothetical protein
MTRRGLALLGVLIGTTAGVEVGLRLLRPLGYPLDRWIGACEPRSVPSPLNHAPSHGVARQQLGPVETYGQSAGWEYEETFDARGIKLSALRPQDGNGTRVLFLGDSFIQGYDDANTIPQRAYEWIMAQRVLPQPLIILNAAYSSYSPVIFTVQARELLPIVRPDFVVVDIDETDLFDDAVRYRGLVERDADGKPIAIDRNPQLAALTDGAARARCYASDLLRVLVSLYYQLRLSLYERQSARSERLFSVGETPDGTWFAELREQMQYFSTTLDEFFATLKADLPAERILVVRHPHLRHLHGPQGVSLNREVGELVSAAATRNGISFFDAQDELEVRFAGHPERYYWNGDMHFNFDGIRAYGELVGRELLRKLDASRS